MTVMGRFELNWRYLAWRRWPDKTWTERVDKLGRSLAELTVPSPAQDVIEAIEAIFRRDDLQFVDLLEAQHLDLMRENLSHLLRAAPYGTLRHLAQRLNVSASTVSRWAAGETCPRPEHLRTLYDVLSLPHDLDLNVTPVFLTDAPSTHAARVKQVDLWINALSPTTLTRLYPALERLLKEP